MSEQQAEGVPPHSGLPAARRTVAAGALVALSILGDSWLYAVLPIHYAETGITLGAVGLILSANRWVRFATNPLAGAMGARWGWSLAFAGALWLGALTTAGYGLLKGILLLVGLRALWGLSWSFLRLGGMAAVLAESRPGRRGRLMGLFTGIFRLGSVVGVVVGGFLADRIGFSATALLFAGLSALGAVAGSLPGALGGRWGAPGRNGRTEARSLRRPLHGHWLPQSGPQWAVSLSAATLHMVVSGLVTSTVALLVASRLGAQLSAGSWVLGAATFTGLILGSRFLVDLAVGPALGHGADRWGRGPILAGTIGLLAIALAALGQSGRPVSVALWALLLFACGTGASAILDGWAGDLAGERPERFLPVYSTWLDIGAAAGPLLGYALVARWGLTATYWSGSAALLLSLGFSTYLARRPSAGVGRPESDKAM